MECIGEAFGLDRTDDDQREDLSIKPATLQSIFDVYLKTSARMRTGAPSGEPSFSQASSSAPPSHHIKPTSQDKKIADNHKAEGNAHMSTKRYQSAIDSYTRAIELDPTNPVYYSNRAAAYSSNDDHDSAILDARRAAELDPTFVKAYSRLG